MTPTEERKAALEKVELLFNALIRRVEDKTLLAEFIRLRTEIIDLLSPSEPVAQGWQDISTAPRDGTRILVGGGNCPYVHENRFTDMHGQSWLQGLGDAEQPTKWQPLPPPPPKGAE